MALRPGLYRVRIVPPSFGVENALAPESPAGCDDGGLVGMFEPLAVIAGATATLRFAAERDRDRGRKSP